MAVRSELTPVEAADRVAIRELFDASAHRADRRDAEGQKALFTAGTRFAVYMGGEGSEPTYALEDRRWYFAERKLLLDWSETRPSTPGT